MWAEGVLGEDDLQVDGERPEVSIDSIVLATDLSATSENAGRYARQLAHHYAAQLLAAHAFVPTQAAMEAEAVGKNLSVQRERLFERVTGVARGLSGDGIEARPVLVEGPTETAIAKLADEHGPAMIVLGTEGRSRINREFIGSTAEKILRSTPWPCLVIGPHVPSAAPDAVPFRMILYATDFTPAAAQAAIFAISLASESGAKMDVLNVVPPRTIEHPDRISELEEQFYGELDRLVPSKAREFCNPRSFVETGNAHQRIHEHIVNRGIDLLVIGLRKSSHLDLAIRTSDAFRLIVESPCPVLTIRS